MTAIPITVTFPDGSMAGRTIEWPVAVTPPSPPPVQGWPSKTNVGVPAGTTLKVANASNIPQGCKMYGSGVQIVSDGVILDGYSVAGDIDVMANNVTIRKTSGYRINFETNPQTGQPMGKTGLICQDFDIYGVNNNGYISGLAGSNFKAYRGRIWGVGQGVHVGTNWELYDLWIDELVGGNISSWGGPSHNEAVFSGGGAHGVINHCWLGGFFAKANGGGMSAALALYGWQATQSDVLVQNSYLDSEAYYAAYGGGTHTNTQMTNVRFLNNTFGMHESGFSKNTSAIAAYDKGVRGNVASGNVWTDGTKVAQLN